jgi:hypothetical protein
MLHWNMEKYQDPLIKSSRVAVASVIPIKCLLLYLTDLRLRISLKILPSVR